MSDTALNMTSGETHSDAPGDLLYGAGAIARFLGIPEKACRHRIEAKLIPTFKIPGASTICARRSTLNEWLASCEREAGR